MREVEIVICAAIKTDTGKVIRCHRHGDGYLAMEQRHLSPYNTVEGFITSENRFVTREEGYEIQRAAGIRSCQPGGYDKGRLFSEDLY